MLRIASANGVIGENVDHLSLPEGARRTIEQSGSIFVKLGQVASTRGDILRRVVRRALQVAQQRRAGARERHARHIEKQLGVPVTEAYSTFDSTLIASASIAQVYAATLHDGSEVVVKVQRPGLDEIVAIDTEAIMSIAGVTENRTPLGLSMKPTDLASSSTG